MMNIEAAIALIDQDIYHHTNKHLNDLQQAIVIQVLQGYRYWEIADEYGCTEGHAKDTASLLWKLLSVIWDKKVTKSNFRSLVTKQLQKLARPEPNLGADLTGTFLQSVFTENIGFVGRQQAIANLQDFVQQNSKVIVLQGEGGVGKTTLAQQFLHSQDFDLVLEVLMAKETSNIIEVSIVVEEWLQRDLAQNAGKEFGITLARFKRCLEQHRVGILIDNLEPALDKNGKFISPHRDYLELLRILADPKVQSVTVITSRDRLCEAEINLQHYRVPGLDLAAWHKYFKTYQIKFEEQTILNIHQTYGGNAKVMGILCGIVQEDYDGDLEQYWQENSQDPLVETDLKNLVVNQLDRLQKLDLQAYALLCRLGCYRYQDLTKISQPGILCLLWDVDTTKRRRVIKSLRNRSLLEFNQGEYWLHPMVQTEARLRLKSSPLEWQQTHQQIADFLTTSVARINNIADGLTALEAYYHNVAIQDYAGAAKIILYSRENQWGQFLTLGATLCRLGIIQPLLAAINQILELIDNDRYQSELNNILGDLYWTAGKVHQAIACQQKTIATSQKCLQSIPANLVHKHDLYYWRMLQIDSLLSLGLYNIDLWELATAADLFQTVIDLAHNTKHHAWSEKAALALELVKSYLDASGTPKYIVSRLYRLIVDLEDPSYHTGRFAYFMQMLGQIYFNYQRPEFARTIWHKAIAFSQSSHYTQVEAKSLVGLGCIERQAGNFKLANQYHQKAVMLLEQITAKCDLAEAYFQWGITRYTDNQKPSPDLFQPAVELFKQIAAPKQIVRISLAIDL